MLLCGWAETLDQLVALRALQGVGGWLVLLRSRDEDVKRHETFDLAGAVLLVPAVGLGVLALTQVSVWPLASPAMLGSVAASILFLVLFLRRERKTRWPVVDVELFRTREFAAGFVGVVMGYALLYGMLSLMSFAFVKGLDSCAHVAGLKLATIPTAR